MNTNNYKIIEPRNLKIEKDLFEIQKTMIYIYKYFKKEIQIIKEKLEKNRFRRKYCRQKK